MCDLDLFGFAEVLWPNRRSRGLLALWRFAVHLAGVAPWDCCLLDLPRRRISLRSDPGRALIPFFQRSKALLA